MVREIIFSDPGGYQFVSIRTESTKVGTVAQVNQGVLLKDRKKEDVAIRFLKPGVRRGIDIDLAIIRDFFGLLQTHPERLLGAQPNLDQIFAITKRAILADIDLETTRNRHLEGYRAYKGLRQHLRLLVQ